MQAILTLKKVFLLCFILGSYALFGQDLDLKPVSNTYFLKNVNIVQAPGRIIPFGSVLIDDGLIKAVGTNLKIPSNAQVIEADSMYVYSGFIDGLSHAGVPKKEQERIPNDVLAMDPPYKWAGITPDHNVIDDLDSEEKSIERLREAGITIAQIVPHGGMLAGSGALIFSGKGEKSSLVFKSNTTQFASLDGARGVFPSTTIGVMAKMRDLYENSINAGAHIDNYRANPSGMERPKYDPVLNALIPVTRKQQTLTYDVEDDLDVFRVLALKQELGFSLVLANGESIWNAIPQIKASGASVFLSIDLPKEFKRDTAMELKTEFDKERLALEKRKEEAYKNYASQAAKFHSAGITFGISTMEGKPGDLKKNLKIMIDHGLPEDVALAAITTNPAGILGLSSSLGTVDKGKIANLVVSTGPYFDDDSKIKYVFVDGSLYEMDTRKKKKGSGDASSIVGTWNYEANDSNGSSEGAITFVSSGGEVTGSMTNGQVPVPGDVSEVSLDGNELSFTVLFNVQGESLEITAEVILEGDSFSGEMSTPFGVVTINGQKNPDN